MLAGLNTAGFPRQERLVLSAMPLSPVFLESALVASQTLGWLSTFHASELPCPFQVAVVRDSALFDEHCFFLEQKFRPLKSFCLWFDKIDSLIKVMDDVRLCFSYL